MIKRIRSRRSKRNNQKTEIVREKYNLVAGLMVEFAGNIITVVNGEIKNGKVLCSWENSFIDDYPDGPYGKPVKTNLYQNKKNFSEDRERFSEAWFPIEGLDFITKT